MIADVDWNEEFRGKSINEMWVSIRGCVRNAMSDHIPLKKRKWAKDPPWMDGEIRKCIREKREAWKKWKDGKKEKDREARRVQEKSRTN